MTQPLTRDLNETIRALEISEAELLFQANRLATRTEASTEQEREHLTDLRDGYTNAARYLRILLNYHEGRARSRERSGRPSSEAQEGAIDARGRSGAFMDEGTDRR